MFSLTQYSCDVHFPLSDIIFILKPSLPLSHGIVIYDSLTLVRLILPSLSLYTLPLLESHPPILGYRYFSLRNIPFRMSPSSKKADVCSMRGILVLAYQSQT